MTGGISHCMSGELGPPFMPASEDCNQFHNSASLLVIGKASGMKVTLSIVQ